MICDSVYRHFKGNEYRVVAIAMLRFGPWDMQRKYVVYVPSSISSQYVWWLPTFLGRDSETNQICLIEKKNENEVFITHTNLPKDTKTVVWVRPIKNFLEILHSGTIEQTTNYARFQLISGEPIG